MPKKKKLQIRNSTAEFLIFTNQAKEDGIEVRVQDETIWLSQKLMAALFDCSTDNISLHLKNIFNENELEEKAVTEEFSVTASDGKSYITKHYNLDAIIAVGYRVNSKRATAFRQWSTSILRDYAIHGQTAAELILSRANAEKEHMGLTSWESGKVTALMAKVFAESEFEKYRFIQDRLFESDFDKEIKGIKGGQDHPDA